MRKEKQELDNKRTIQVIDNVLETLVLTDLLNNLGDGVYQVMNISDLEQEYLEFQTLTENHTNQRENNQLRNHQKREVSRHNRTIQSRMRHRTLIFR